MRGSAADDAVPARRASDREAPDGANAVDGEPAHISRLSYGHHLRVLLVASDEGTAESFLSAAEESVLDVQLEVSLGADEALTLLARAAGQRRRRNDPDIVVCTLEVAESHRLLTCLREDARFDSLPLVVLSDEVSPSLERRSFSLGAAGHLRAPRRDYERVALVHALPDFMPLARAAHLQVHPQR